MAPRSAVRTVVVASLLAAAPFLGVPSAGAEVDSDSCSADVRQSNGAEYRICMPALWNGDLVVFAHGYVPDLGGLPEIPDEQLVLSDDVSIPGLVTGLGYAFAVTSYPDNGLAVERGVDDLSDLVGYFETEVETANRVYIVGASEGSLIATLAIERYSRVFSGGLALCGPVGDFRKQVNYYGDFRVVFDYFFPNVMPGSAVWIPQDLVTKEHWEGVVKPSAIAALRLHPAKTAQLLAVTRLPVDPGNPEQVADAVLGVLWYSFFATNDARSKLHGQPFDNRFKFYTGSSNDFALNRGVARHRASWRALLDIQANYQTSGSLPVFLVTMHTTGDPIVPYWHEPLYRLKTWLSGSGAMHTNLPVFRYGHCQFEPIEALIGFGLLVYQVQVHGP